MDIQELADYGIPEEVIKLYKKEKAVKEAHLGF